MDDWKKSEICNYIQITLHAVCLGPSLEEKLLVSCDISSSGQEQIKLNTSDVGHKALGPGSSKNHPSLTAKNGGAIDGRVSGTTIAEAEKTSDQNLSIEESGELMKYSAKVYLTKYRSNANTLSINLKMNAAWFLLISIVLKIFLMHSFLQLTPTILLWILSAVIPFKNVW